MRSKSLIIHKTIKRKTKLKRTQKKQGKKKQGKKKQDKKSKQRNRRTKQNKKEKILNSLKKSKRTQKKQLTKRKTKNKKHQGGSSLKPGYEGGSDNDDDVSEGWGVTPLSAANRFGRGPSDKKRFTMVPVLEEPGSSSVRGEDLESGWKGQPPMTLHPRAEIEEKETKGTGESTSFFSKLMCPGLGCLRPNYAKLEQGDDEYSFSVGEMVDYNKKRVEIVDIFSEGELPPYFNQISNDQLKDYAKKMCKLKLPGTHKNVKRVKVKKTTPEYNQELIDQITTYRKANPRLVEIRWKRGFYEKKKLVDKGELSPVEYGEGWVPILSKTDDSIDPYDTYDSDDSRPVSDLSTPTPRK